MSQLFYLLKCSGGGGALILDRLNVVVDELEAITATVQEESLSATVSEESILSATVVESDSTSAVVTEETITVVITCPPNGNGEGGGGPLE